MPSSQTTSQTTRSKRMIDVNQIKRGVLTHALTRHSDWLTGVIGGGVRFPPNHVTWTCPCTWHIMDHHSSWDGCMNHHMTPLSWRVASREMPPGMVVVFARGCPTRAAPWCPMLAVHSTLPCKGLRRPSRDARSAHGAEKSPGMVDRVQSFASHSKLQ